MIATASVPLALLAVLTLARRLMEPSCPSCSAKSWAPHSTQLQCTHCGWTATKPEPLQYELRM